MNTLISRRTVLAYGASTALALSIPVRARAAGWNRYRDAIVIDGLGFPGSLSAEPDAPLTDAHVKDVRDSGLTCVHTTILPVGTTAPDTAFTQAIRGVASWEREIDAHPDTFVRVRTAADILAARKAGRTGLIYGFQDAVAFETDLGRLQDLHRFGIRVIQPTYNRRNLLGDGCLEPANAGLSRTGIEAIERMNALGILVDLSHCGRQTAADVIHHLEHMIDVAGEEHVSVGTDGSISGEVLDQKYKDAFARDTRERREAGIAAPHETEDGYLFASDLNTPRRFETLAALLADRGHSATRIEKILGRNLLRVFSDTWKA